MVSYKITQKNHLEVAADDCLADQCVFEGIPEPLPAKPFSMVVVGTPGSGKSTLVNWLVADVWGKAKCFDEVIIVMPRHSQATVGNPKIRAHLENHPENVFEDLGQNIDEILERIKSNAEVKPKPRTTLVFVDDATQAFRKAGPSGQHLLTAMKRLLTCYRHLYASVICNVHFINAMELALRRVVNTWVLFRSGNMKEVECISEEILGVKTSDGKKLLQQLWNVKEYSFIMARIVRGQSELYLNFFRIEITEDDEGHSKLKQREEPDADVETKQRQK